MPMPCRTRIGVLAALPLFTAFLTGTGDGTQEPAARAADTPRVIAQQRLAARRLAMERRELKRQDILNRLEFIPRPALPEYPVRLQEFCLLPANTFESAIDPHRSLFVHDSGTLVGPGLTAVRVDFSLKRTLGQIANQVSVRVPGTTAVSIFRQFWDTQNPAPGVTTGPHCSDAGGTINGFPIQCPRNEGREALGTDSQIESRMADYRVLALVNRIDLAHEGWSNCGEYRIVYGKPRAGSDTPTGRGTNLIIFEAVLPNPRPGCRESCMPVAEFWKSLSAIDDSVLRAEKLQTFFYQGLPGFRPVVHVDHYSAAGVTGSGQIRTNQFLTDQPWYQYPQWLLKEFKTVIDCGVSPCQFAIVPIMVKVSPPRSFWSEDNADPRAVDFRADTLLQKAALASTSLMDIDYEVDLINDAGESASFTARYSTTMNAAAATTFRTALVTGNLTANQMANRAATQSCAGCHMPRELELHLPDSIGTVTTPKGSPVSTINTWPAAAAFDFVHVDVTPRLQPELAANPAAFPNGWGYEISPALLDFFLPARKSFLLDQLNSLRCMCKHRYLFLRVPMRRIALDIETRIQQQFAARVEDLEKKIAEAQDSPPDPESLSSLARERADLIAERDKVLSAELRRKGITLPEDELLNLKPQSMKLKAAGIAKGNAARASGLRIEEVNRILREEPPRRTVTGSFRAH